MEGLFNSNEIINYIKEQRKNGLSQTEELSLYFKATQKSLDEGLPNLQLWLDYIQVLSTDKECVEEIRNIFVCILKPRYKKFVLFWEGYLEFEKRTRGSDFYEKVGKPSLKFVKEKNFEEKVEIIKLIERLSRNNNDTTDQIVELDLMKKNINLINSFSAGSQNKVNRYDYYDKKEEDFVVSEDLINRKMNNRLEKEENLKVIKKYTLNKKGDDSIESADKYKKQIFLNSELSKYDTFLKDRKYDLNYLKSNSVHRNENLDSFKLNEDQGNTITVDGERENYEADITIKKRNKTNRHPLGIKNTSENLKSLSHCNISTPYSGNCDENLRIDMKCDTTNLGSVDLNFEMDGFSANTSNRSSKELGNLDKCKNSSEAGYGDELQWILFKGKKIYKIKQIGSGGTSKVYQVLYNKEIYALKHVNIKEEIKESYLNEIKLLEKLKDKAGIIKIVDYELSGKDLFLILECGETNLHKLMKNKLNINFIKYIWEQMLTILEIVHDERIIHKDLKPQNFVLVKGELKLIDFGISKELKNDTTKIINDSLVGTIDYMSPESINSDLKLGKSTDVWSMGIILYEIVYGETPFKKYKTLVQKINAFKELKIEYKETEFVTLVNVMKLCLNVDRTKRMTVKELLWMCKSI